MSLPDGIERQLAPTPDSGWSEAQRLAIAGEVKLLLENPTFKSSKRCVALLSWLAEYELAGNPTAPKERTLGVTVFGRPHDYDTNNDPIVRMTANEVRKRLAMYYEDPDSRSRSTVRIRLAPGAYGLEFDFRRTALSGVNAQPEASADRTAATGSPASPEVEPLPAVASRSETPNASASQAASAANQAGRQPKAWRRSGMLALGVCCVALLLLAAFPPDNLRSAQYMVWKPVFDAGQLPMICLAEEASLTAAQPTQRSESGRTPAADIPLVPAYSFADLNVAHKLSLYLARHGKEATMRQPRDIGLWEFSHQPVVLIGTGVGMWPSILFARLRFTPQADPVTGLLRVRDTQNPQSFEWVQTAASEKHASVDYGILTRYRNEDTGSWIYGINGLGLHGTEAAGQLLIDPALASILPREVRSMQNFQIVVRASVINGKTGLPHIASLIAW